MYTENAGKDVFLFVKAVLSNSLARLAPKLYVNLTRQTGRGNVEEDASQVAEYFIRCFHDYREHLGLAETDFKQYLKQKRVLEYGPGDILGVALLMYAHGADLVHCVDRFPLQKISDKNLQVYKLIIESLSGEERDRICRAFVIKGRPETGFNPSAIRYSVTKHGISGQIQQYDLIISRAVLEHVNNLEKTFLDINRSLKRDGLSIHLVDLKSHGLDRYQPFDFLTWPDILYRLMFSQKGFPNRWRVDKYRELARNSGLRFKCLTPTGKLELHKLDQIQPRLARVFRDVHQDDLSWLGFWMVLEHA